MRVSKRDHWSVWVDKMLTKIESIETTTDVGTSERLAKLKEGQPYSTLLRLSLDGQAQFVGHPGARRRGGSERH